MARTVISYIHVDLVGPTSRPNSYGTPKGRSTGPGPTGNSTGGSDYVPPFSTGASGADDDDDSSDSPSSSDSDHDDDDDLPSYVGTKYAGGRYSGFASRREDPSSPATPTPGPRSGTSNATGSSRDRSRRPYSGTTGQHRRRTPPRSGSSTGPPVQPVPAPNFGAAHAAPPTASALSTCPVLFWPKRSPREMSL